MQLRFGDLIQCRDTHYNRGLGIVNKVGMVVELRRKDFRVLFDAGDQSIWLSKSSVNRITLPPREHPRLLDRLHWLIEFLDAGECDLEIDEAGHYRATIICGELDLPRVLAVRDSLAGDLVSLRMLPRGMSRLGLEIVFRDSG
jgi:hypothetical protein